MIRTFAVITALTASIGFASAEMSVDQMSKATGLANILKNANACEYSIDQPALESYYVGTDLATPEVLSYISGTVALAEFNEPPSESECTMARVTARSIGILAE